MHRSDGLSPRILETLRQLGLTEYGARCYVALLGLRAAEASAIAEAAEVPRTKVYATLKDLADAGWILAEGGRPVVYRAVAPEDRIAQEEKRLAEQVADTTRELQARFATRSEMVPMSVYMLRGADTIVAKSVEMLSHAREEAFLNLGFLLPPDAQALGDAVAKARKRGVRVHVLLANSLDARGLGELERNARDAVFPFRGIMVDARQVLLVLPGRDAPVGLWNPTQTFVELIAPMLQGAWDAAPAWDA